MSERVIQVNKLQILTWTILILILQGCISTATVQSTKTNPEAKGIRYSLPSPFILVTPATDGTVEVKTVFLPDPDHEYAIHTDSYLASHGQTVTLDGAFLQKFSFSEKDLALAKSIIGEYHDESFLYSTRSRSASGGRSAVGGSSFRHWHRAFSAGCRGFIGPVPQPLLMSAFLCRPVCR